MGGWWVFRLTLVEQIRFAVAIRISRPLDNRIACLLNLTYLCESNGHFRLRWQLRNHRNRVCNLRCFHRLGRWLPCCNGTPPILRQTKKSKNAVRRIAFHEDRRKIYRFQWGAASCFRNWQEAGPRPFPRVSMDPVASTHPRRPRQGPGRAIAQNESQEDAIPSANSSPIQPAQPPQPLRMPILHLFPPKPPVPPPLTLPRQIHPAIRTE